MKRLSIFFISLFFVFMLVGCGSYEGEIKILEDSSANIDINVKISENGIESLRESGLSLENEDSFIYNIEGYREKSIKGNYNLVELNNLKDIFGNKVIDFSEDGLYYYIDIDMTKYKEKLVDLVDKNKGIITIYLPGNIEIVEGEEKGIDIHGCVVNLNFLEIEKCKLRALRKSENFNDIEGHWAYYPIKSLANTGIVRGVGTGDFCPNKNITRAAFYEMLARVKGLEVGKYNGYWAYTAIQNCKNMGYNLNNDLVNIKNYSVPITREEAITALVLAKDIDKETIENPINYEEVQIPDIDKVSEEYKHCILVAYYIGLTNGVDKNKTFDPKGNLTRASICQLFYNLNWCKPIEVRNIDKNLKEISEKIYYLDKGDN